MKIRRGRPQLKDRRLRLIHSGKLLTDTTSLDSLLGSQEQRQKQGSIPDVNASHDAASPTTWLHCSVGPQMIEGEEDETKIQASLMLLPSPSPVGLCLRSRCLIVLPQTAQLKPLRGFDRLAAAGFSEQDIANIRMQFHAHSAGDYLDQDFTSEEERLWLFYLRSTNPD